MPMWFPGGVNAGLFACVDTQGAMIVTDRPTQLSQCRPFQDRLSDSQVEPRSSLRHELPLEPPPSTSNATPDVSSSLQPESPPQLAILSAPLERIGSLFVVSILINEIRPARLILDTGASHTILSRAIARDLGLWSQQASTSVSMHTAGGTVQADLMQIDSIRIAGAEVRHSLAAIHDLPDAPPDIEGLLGLSVLRHFEVTLDAPRNRLLLGTARP
jgi:clan AA aspartic protease (TIGR02281 family)